MPGGGFTFARHDFWGRAKLYATGTAREVVSASTQMVTQADRVTREAWVFLNEIHTAVRVVPSPQTHPTFRDGRFTSGMKTVRTSRKAALSRCASSHER